MSAGQGVRERQNMQDDDSDYGKPIVRVEGIERGREEESGHSEQAKKEKEPERHFHEGETVKTTYTVEEDTPSLYQRLKGKFIAAEYQVRSMVADYNKKAPHHEKKHSGSTEQATHKPQVAQIKKQVSGDDGNTAEEELKEDRKVQAGEEIGTGYEESSEEGGVSPGSSASGSIGSLPAQSESLFKPVKPKDESDVTLEELRASKLNQNSSAEDIKAPGMFTRVKEEVDAITDKVTEGLGLKKK